MPKVRMETDAERAERFADFRESIAELVTDPEVDNPSKLLGALLASARDTINIWIVQQQHVEAREAFAERWAEVNGLPTGSSFS